MSDGCLSKEELSLPSTSVLAECQTTQEENDLQVEKLESGTVISEDNVGHRLLRLMGWSGGGLGKPGQEGISEPIRFANLRSFHLIRIVNFVTMSMCRTV